MKTSQSLIPQQQQQQQQFPTAVPVAVSALTLLRRKKRSRTAAVAQTKASSTLQLQGSAVVNHDAVFWPSQQAMPPQQQQLPPRLYLLRRNSAPPPPWQQTSSSTTITCGGTPDAKGNHHHQEGVFELDLGITEIAGEAGSGKTQLCLGLCVSCATTSSIQLHAAASSSPSASLAIYVSMGEGSTPAQLAYRMSQMAEARGNYTLSPNNNTSACAPNDNVMRRISILSIRNDEDFLEFVRVGLVQLLQGDEEQQNAHQVGLVVLDSIAGLFRVPETLPQQRKNFYSRRSMILFQVAARLKELSDSFSVPIVVVNQVTSGGVMSPSFEPKSRSTMTTMPSLGLSWSNCVNVRYLLSRCDVPAAGGSSPVVVVEREPSSNKSRVHITGDGGTAAASNRYGHQRVTPDDNGARSTLGRDDNANNNDKALPATVSLRKAQVLLSSSSPQTTTAFFRIDAAGGLMCPLRPR